MGDRNNRLTEGYLQFGMALAGIMQQVAAGAVVMGADFPGGIHVFATRHPGIAETVKQLGKPVQTAADGLPEVEGGFMLRSYIDFENAARVHLGEELAKVNTNTALVALLCDAVRLVREATMANPGPGETETIQ